MKSSKSLNLQLFLGVLLFFFLLLTAGSAFSLDRQKAVVREVLTGDSVRLKGGKILRYAGLHAPPLQSIIPLMRQYGANALDFNKSLVEGKNIVIEWGSQIRDNQNNLIGYVYLEDGTFVNLEMIKSGNAKAVVMAPNLRYAGNFRQAELKARREKKGIWKEEPENPFIKSEYIGEINTKIYYFPTSPELDRIPKSQLVTFRSRVEAKAAGYKACNTCHENTDEEF